MEWSVDGQTPEFLAATRMITLSDRIAHDIVAQLGLRAGMGVLDAGCGSGEYCFRLGSQVEGVRFTGLDNDDRFAKFAQDRADGLVGWPFEAPSPANEYRFVCGDGLNLPFPDGAFDAVVSHTYLTAVPDWQRALAEMVRVCKLGGVVSSVTSMTDDFYGSGVIGLFTAQMDPDDLAFLLRIDDIEREAFGVPDLTAGIAPRQVPAAFAAAGLDDVRCMPIAQYFCLSDAATSPEDYARHVELLHRAEQRRFRRLSTDPRTAPALTAGEWERYKRLEIERYEQLVRAAESNREWNWYGNSALLVAGTR